MMGTYRHAFRCASCGWRGKRAAQSKNCLHCEDGRLVLIEDSLRLFLGTDRDGVTKTYVSPDRSDELVTLEVFRRTPGGERRWKDYCDLVLSKGYRLGEFVRIKIVPESRKDLQ